MKKILLLFALFAFQSCTAQYDPVFGDVPIQPTKIHNGVLTVIQIENDEATLESKEFKVHYVVDRAQLVIGKEYFFRLLIQPSHQRKKNAKVLSHTVTCLQANKDAQALMAVEY